MDTPSQPDNFYIQHKDGKKDLSIHTWELIKQPEPENRSEPGWFKNIKI